MLQERRACRTVGGVVSAGGETMLGHVELLELRMSCKRGTDANVRVVRGLIWRGATVECSGGEVSYLVVRQCGDRGGRGLRSGVC